MINTERIVYIASKIEDLKDFKVVLEDDSLEINVKVVKHITPEIHREQTRALTKKMNNALVKEIDFQIMELTAKIDKLIIDGFNSIETPIELQDGDPIRADI